MVDNKEIGKVDVQYTIDSKIQDFLTNVEMIGFIVVKNSPSHCNQFVKKKDRHLNNLQQKKNKMFKLSIKSL